MDTESINFVASCVALDMIESGPHCRADKDAMIEHLATHGPAIREEAPINMFLIYPGMTDFEEVELSREIAEPGYCYVRPFGSDDLIKVATSRLVDRETMLSRRHTQIIERHDDMGRWTVEEKSVTA
jgi:hypothetical protein